MTATNGKWETFPLQLLYVVQKVTHFPTTTHEAALTHTHTNTRQNENIFVFRDFWAITAHENHPDSQLS